MNEKTIIYMPTDDDETLSAEIATQLVSNLNAELIGGAYNVRIYRDPGDATARRIVNAIRELLKEHNKRISAKNLPAQSDHSGQQRMMEDARSTMRTTVLIVPRALIPDYINGITGALIPSRADEMYQAVVSKLDQAGFFVSEPHSMEFFYQLYGRQRIRDQ